tara:strand:- start:21843 stop:22631 length:789 start_codon:yes stop_codon:yes gene_type:complete
MTQALIDSHCHPPSGSSTEWLERALEAGVRECIAIGTDLEDWGRYRSLANEFPDNVHWTAGLHPCHVGDDFEAHLTALPEFLDTVEGKPPCALGEIGLDFTRLPKEQRDLLIQQQSEAFTRQLILAKERDLPVVVHSRGTVPECLSILEETNFPANRAIFHCFTEGPDSLQAILSAGARCSFTGIITFKNAREVRESLERNGLENLILETDSPYLSPEPYRGKLNEPCRIDRIAEYCAEFFATSKEKIAEITRRNTYDFFGL